MKNKKNNVSKDVNLIKVSNFKYNHFIILLLQDN